MHKVESFARLLSRYHDHTTKGVPGLPKWHSTSSAGRSWETFSDLEWWQGYDPASCIPAAITVTTCASIYAFNPSLFNRYLPTNFELLLFLLDVSDPFNLRFAIDSPIHTYRHSARFVSRGRLVWRWISCRTWDGIVGESGATLSLRASYQ